MRRRKAIWSEFVFPAALGWMLTKQHGLFTGAWFKWFGILVAISIALAVAQTVWLFWVRGLDIDSGEVP